MHPGRTPTVWRARSSCIACNLCCWDTEMLLLPEDVERLEALGYRREEFAEPDDRGLLRLRNTPRGHCVFLDPSTGRCRVYEHRPLGCSFYPIVLDPRSLEPHLDPECPLAHTTRPGEIRRARALARRFRSIAGRAQG